MLLLLVVQQPLLRAQLKGTYGPRFFNATDWDFLMLRDLTDEIWFSQPLFIYCQNNKWCLVFQQRRSFYSATQWRMCRCLCCRFYFICKLCVLHAMEYWQAIHPGLLADTEYVWLQIVWITVDYWTAIQMCVELTVGMSTKDDYLVAGSKPPRK